MQRQRVESSVFRAMGYDAYHGILEAEFQDGDVYQYYRVPPETWQHILRSQSKGEFFAGYIRDQYPFKKIN